MIMGIGIDLVDELRFKNAITRTPKLSERILQSTILTMPTTKIVSVYAILEALYKALPASEKSEIDKFRVGKNENGIYTVKYTGDKLFEAHRYQYHVTVTNESKFTLAVVIIEKL